MTSPGLTDFTYFRGRVALAQILKALGVQKDEEVAIQAFTCSAVPEGILAVGARPLYIDIDARGYTMDPRDLESKLSPATRAVVVQHTFGLPADLTRLQEVAGRHGIPVIEDCAHTVATTVNGRLIGTFGDASFYSFEASKPVFAALGGSAIANQPEVRVALDRSYRELRPPSAFTQVQLLLMFMAHGIAYRPTTYWAIRALFRRAVKLGLVRGNYNPLGTLSPADDFGRSMGTVQQRLLRRALTRLPAQTSHRRWVAEQYRSTIPHSVVEHPRLAAGVDAVLGRYPMVTEARPEILKRAPAAKVEVADFYSTPVQPFSGADMQFVGYELGSCPNAEWLSERVISLPTNTQVTERIVQRTARFFGSIAG